MAKTARQLGYTSEGMGDVEGDRDNDLVPVGSLTKRGDEYLLNSGAWVTLPDKYLNMKVEPNFRPIRRRKRWDCWHLREDRDKHCPVCMVFLRFIHQRW